VHFSACHHHALFTIQRSKTRIRVEELDEAIGLLYRNLGKFAISVESFEEVAFVDLLGWKIA